jgi:hypothetical protein
MPRGFEDRVDPVQRNPTIKPINGSDDGGAPGYSSPAGWIDGFFRMFPVYSGVPGRTVAGLPMASRECVSSAARVGLLLINLFNFYGVRPRSGCSATKTEHLLLLLLLLLLDDLHVALVAIFGELGFGIGVVGLGYLLIGAVEGIVFIN